jgi:hypothetical protein
LVGLQQLNESWNDEESSFWLWLTLHRPGFLKEGGIRFPESIRVEDIDTVKGIPKNQFLRGFKDARRLCHVAKYSA